MRDLPTTDPLIDDIEALIDEALGDPARAATVKARIKSRLGRPAVGQASAESADVTEADAEDLWDNVPL